LTDDVINNLDDLLRYWKTPACNQSCYTQITITSTHWVTLLFGWDRGWAFWLSLKPR